MSVTHFTDYQILIIACLGFLNMVCAGIVWLFCFALIRYKGFRDGLVEAIQNGDKVYHWADAKSFGFFLAGYLCAWFTMNLGGIFAFAKMFEIGPMGFLGLFVGVTFTLWGIAWKKN
jgi:hypothetical protein